MKKQQSAEERKIAQANYRQAAIDMRRLWEELELQGKDVGKEFRAARRKYNKLYAIEKKFWQDSIAEGLAKQKGKLAIINPKKERSGKVGNKWKEMAQERQVFIECLSQAVESMWSDCMDCNNKSDIKRIENRLNRLHDEIQLYREKMYEEDGEDVWLKDRSEIDNKISNL